MLPGGDKSRSADDARGAAQSGDAIRLWTNQMFESSAGLSLLDLLVARPTRPAILTEAFLPVPGDPVLPRAGGKVRRRKRDGSIGATAYGEVTETDPDVDEAAPDVASDGPSAPDSSSAGTVPTAGQPSDHRDTAAMTAARVHNALIGQAEMEWSNVLIESISGAQKLISWLTANQAADLAELSKGYPGLVEHLPTEIAMALHTTTAEAGQLIFRGQRLTVDLPLTNAALTAGAIHTDIATAIHDATAAVATPLAAEVERRILPEVIDAGLTRRQTYRRCQQILAMLDPTDFADRHKAAVQRRGVWRELCTDGMARMTMYGSAEKIAALWQATTVLADAAKTSHDERTKTQRRFDTITDLAEDILVTGSWTYTRNSDPEPTVRVCADHEQSAVDLDLADDPSGSTVSAGSVVGRNTYVPSTSQTNDESPAGLSTGTVATRRRPAKKRRSPVLVNVHVTLDALTGATETPGWIEGLGPIDAETTRRIAADSTWRRIVTDPLSGTVLDVGRTRYQPPEAMAEHIRLRDLTCGRPGCDEPAQDCDLDHREPFRPGHSTGGSTSATNLALACRHDHRAIDGGGFHLTQNPDDSWSWTTVLGRTYTRPQTSIFDLGDNHTSALEYRTSDAIPRWARDLVTAPAVPATPFEFPNPYATNGSRVPAPNPDDPPPF